MTAVARWALVALGEPTEAGGNVRVARDVAPGTEATRVESDVRVARDVAPRMKATRVERDDLQIHYAWWQWLARSGRAR